MLRKLTITMLLFFCTGCGLVGQNKQFFILEMMGLNEAPANATGNTTPQWQKHVLFGVEFLNEDGSETTTLFSNVDEPRTAKVGHRSQIMYSKDVSELKNKTYSAVTLRYSTTVTGGSKNKAEHSLIMSQDSFTLTENFTLEEGKDKTLLVALKWLNTVDGDTMQEPEFVLEFQ